jgi:hypothetical protein
MFRYFVATCAVCAGALISIADVSVALHSLPRPPGGAPQRQTPEDHRFVFDACVTFYGIAFSTGRLLYRWLGAHTEAEELRRWSRWYIALLNIVGGGYLLASGWQAWQQAFVVRPSLMAAAVLLALGGYDGWHALRARSVPPE